eukprot:CAMPEP_0172176936 /NCGR_PEP_ID=MMETSP1050-20130122/15130_1 /TAXON_ID=233186 /ORGANISM="Cryptomonas curvata, Strain CCAP979/52" /LENGTH=194 /DNA_ID=CAMNT_0012849345 /DNA_START=214 /DNA_END=794 /DNA_ORIENTATION=-
MLEKSPIGTRAVVIVSSNTGHQVLMCDNGLQALLDYNPDEAVGRSIRFLFGPETDAPAILSAVKSATSLQHPTTQHAILYGRHGDAQNTVVTCAPYYDAAGAPSGCLVALEASAAITTQQALRECAAGDESTQSAMLLVSAEPPHPIQTINGTGAALLGTPAAQLCGRPLCTVLAPRADDPRLDAAIRAARDGR